MWVDHLLHSRTKHSKTTARLPDMATVVGSRPRIIQDMPTELLSKIFIHSLPRDPLSFRQPDVTIAPMLICQVCVHWREVALRLSELWIRLYHIMRISVTIDEPTDQKALGIHSKDIEFLRWWKPNVRDLAPIVRLEAKMSRATGQRRSKDDESAFIVQFLSSAQYLDMTKDMSTAVRLHFSRGPLDQANLKTFILRDESGLRIFSGEDILLYLDIVPLKPTHPTRRIHLDALFISALDVPKLGWSNLTHAILVNMSITVSGWFALIRECVNLQFGTFDMDNSEQDSDFKEPTITVLPNLRQLIVRAVYTDLDENLLRNLYLPGLTSLRLETSMTEQQLQATLSSTPALKELHLGENLPQDPDTELRSIFNANTSQLTTHIPILERLLLLLYHDELEDFERWLARLLRSEWLQLGQNHIKEIEFTLENPSPQKRQEIFEVLQRQSYEGMDLVLTPAAISLWNQRFDIPTGEVDEFFGHMMFKELLK